MKLNSVRLDDMENERTVQSRLLYRVLRVLAGLMTLVAGLAMSYACIAALFGDQKLLIDFIDEDAASLSMNVPTILAIVTTNVLAIVSLGLLFFSLNRFLKYAERGEMLVDPARNALKRLGVAMVLLYLTTRFVAVVIPVLGISGFWMENRYSLPLTFVDLDFLYLLVGVVLLALGQALREGQVAKEETKQYV
ncbi:hypothetical protein [Parasphingorhabdus sp.]|uniref:hypothetical protein n=1 Tax=Parasphingorhabdus sp. TaxID=2709688 RepID=UPI003BB0B610